MSERSIVEGLAGVVATYELLDRVRTRQDLVIRDDQFDLVALLEAARYADRRGIRLSLVDTGRFGLEEVESLARAGARILTTDEARPKAPEWEILQRACRAAGTHLSVFWGGPLPAEIGAPDISALDLERLLGAGMDFHISDRVRPRDLEALVPLASSARKGKAYFVLYHAGPLQAGLAAVAAERAWVHLADADIAGGAATDLAVEIARSAARAGARAAVHVEQGLTLDVLDALWAAGAVLLFQTPPSDDRSLLRPFEQKAARRRLPLRAYRLTTAFRP